MKNSSPTSLALLHGQKKPVVPPNQVLPPNQKAKLTKKPQKDWVREGTAAVCRAAAGGDMAAGILFHAILELWVETRKKVRRGEQDWLFLSSSQLLTLSGLTKYELRDRAVPRLRACPFFEIRTGRLTRDHPNVYQIRIDQAAFWEEVKAVLDPTKKLTTNEDGYTWTKKVVDSSLLPYLLKRLFQAVGEGL